MLLASYLSRRVFMKQNNLKLTVAIHWLMALLIIGVITVGLYMAYTHTVPLYAWHKSFGLIALLLIIVRLVWRKKQPWQSAAKGSKQEGFVKVIHNLLLLGLVLMPITGMLYSGFLGFGFSLFDWVLVPRNLDENQQVVPYHQAIGALGKTLHWIIGYVFTALISLHIIAALKHHFIDKDDTLIRMLNRRTNKNT